MSEIWIQNDLLGAELLPSLTRQTDYNDKEMSMGSEVLVNVKYKNQHDTLPLIIAKEDRSVLFWEKMVISVQIKLERHIFGVIKMCEQC